MLILNLNSQWAADTEKYLQNNVMEPEILIIGLYGAGAAVLEAWYKFALIDVISLLILI